MRELYQLRDLKQEIAEQQARLARLRGSAEALHSPAFQAGRGSDVSDGVGINAAKIADLETAINRRLEEYWRTYIELEIYIDDIPDSFTRRIFRLRFIDGKSWGNIAWRCGGGCTADSVRKMCRRYVERN